MLPFGKGIELSSIERKTDAKCPDQQKATLEISAICLRTLLFPMDIFNAVGLQQVITVTS